MTPTQAWSAGRRRDVPRPGGHAGVRGLPWELAGALAPLLRGGLAWLTWKPHLPFPCARPAVVEPHCRGR